MVETDSDSQQAQRNQIQAPGERINENVSCEQMLRMTMVPEDEALVEQEAIQDAKHINCTNCEAVSYPDEG